MDMFEMGTLLDFWQEKQVQLRNPYPKRAAFEKTGGGVVTSICL
jgi:hypothetical protein